jgi:hypothetical protein
VSGFGEFQLSYRYGDITVPHLSSVEPLRVECEHFLQCVATGQQPLTDGYEGLRVVRVLEASDRSLSDGGRSVPVEAYPEVARNGAAARTMVMRRLTEAEGGMRRARNSNAGQ